MNRIYNRGDKKKKRRNKMSKRKKLNNVIRGRILIKNRSGFNIFVEAIKPKDCETIRTSYLGLISTHAGATPPITIRSKALVLNGGATQFYEKRLEANVYLGDTLQYNVHLERGDVLVIQPHHLNTQDMIIIQNRSLQDLHIEFNMVTSSTSTKRVLSKTVLLNDRDILVSERTRLEVIVYHNKSFLCCKALERGEVFVVLPNHLDIDTTIKICNNSLQDLLVEVNKPGETENIVRWFGFSISEVVVTPAILLSKEVLWFNSNIQFTGHKHLEVSVFIEDNLYCSKTLKCGEIFDIQSQHLVNKNQTRRIWNYIYFISGLLFVLFVICLKVLS